MIEMDIDDVIQDFEAVMDRVEAGERITIVVNGSARAALVPFEPLHDAQGVRA